MVMKIIKLNRLLIRIIKRNRMFGNVIKMNRMFRGMNKMPIKIIKWCLNAFQTQQSPTNKVTTSGSGTSQTKTTSATATQAVASSNSTSKIEQKPVECNLCHRKFKNIPALNGHMRLHGGYFKKVTTNYTPTKQTSGILVLIPNPYIRGVFKVFSVCALEKIEKKLEQNKFSQPFLELHQISLIFQAFLSQG